MYGYRVMGSFCSQLLSVALFCALWSCSGSAQAQFTWVGQGANGNWGNPANWNTPLVPPSLSSVTFAGSNNALVNLGVNRVVVDLTFDAVAPFTLSNNTLSIFGDVTTSNSIALPHEIASNVSLTSFGNWNIADSAELEVKGDISGSGGIVKQGPGDLFLTDANSYTGGTVFEQGIVSVEDDASLGATTGPLTFNGGDLRWDAAFDLDPSRAITLDAGGGTLRTRTFNTTISQAITGAGGLTKAGAGTLTLGGVNTYTGDTNIDNGSVALGVFDALKTSTVEINLDNGLDINGLDAYLGALAGSGDLDIGSLTLRTGFNGANTTYSGVITGASGSRLLHNGSGTLTLTGGTSSSPMSFDRLRADAGATVLDGAQVDLNGNGNFAAGPLATMGGDIVIQNGSEVRVTDSNGFSSIELGTLIITGVETSLDVNRGLRVGDVEGNPASVVVDDQAVFTIAGNFTVGDDDRGDLTVQTGGSVSANAISFGRDDTGVSDSLVTGVGSALSASSLGLGGQDDNGSDNLGGTGVLTIDDHATADVDGPTTFWTSASSLTVDGGAYTTDTLAEHTGVTGAISLSDPAGDAALTVGTAGGSSTFGGLIQDASGGAGSLKKVGAGSLTLNGVNTFSGDTQIDGGTVVVGHVEALKTTTVNINVDNGLDINGLDAELGALAGSGDLDLGAQDVQVGFNDASTTYSGVITGTVDSLLRHQGEDTLTLTGGTESTPSVFGTLRSQQNGGAIDVDGAHIELTAANVGISNGALRATGGDIRLLNGAKVNLDAADGDALARNALLQISGVGTTLTANRLDIDSGGAVLVEEGALLELSIYNVAWLGNGDLGVQSGATVNVSDFVAVGVTSGDLGNIEVSGDGSLLSTDSLRLGGRTGGQNGGVGELTVDQGGSVQVASQTTFYTLASNIIIDGGKMSTDTLVEFTDVTGTISLSDPSGDVALTIGAGDGDSTFGGLIEDASGGPGSLKKVGAGSLTLAGANTYTGDTIVDGGTLSLAQDFLADTADVILNAAATLDLTHVATDTIDELILDGFPRAAGTHGAIGSGADFEWAQITGTGLLEVTSFTGLAGDYNGDGRVNIADYTVWRDNLGSAAGTLVNDPHTGIIGPAQYATWKTNFGATLSCNQSLEHSTVPEPATWLLMATGLGAACSCRRKN